MRKPYSWPSGKTKRTGEPSPIIVQYTDKQHWLPVVLSSLSILLTPITVAIITSNANQSSTNKDYVSLAINILNSKNSTPENRKWALRLLSKMSPVPFSEESEKQLSGGSGLINSSTILSAYGPNNPLIKADEPFIQPCQPVYVPHKKWSDKEISNYIVKLGMAYKICAARQQAAVAILDSMQNTNNTKAQIAQPIYPEKYIVYKLK